MSENANKLFNVFLQVFLAEHYSLYINLFLFFNQGVCSPRPEQLKNPIYEEVSQVGSRMACTNDSAQPHRAS
jgi:hypothetical protein